MEPPLLPRRRGVDRATPPPMRLPRAEGRGVAQPDGTIVVIHLVGGVDGLSVLVPYADPAYAGRRPNLAVPRPRERYGAIEIDRGLGLHPALAPIWERLGRSDRLAVIGGVGIPDDEGGNRGHLPSREFVHRGGRFEVDGWAARLLRFEGLRADALWSFGPGPHPMFDGVDDRVAPEVAPARPGPAAAPRRAVPVGAPDEHGAAARPVAAVGADPALADPSPGPGPDADPAPDAPAADRWSTGEWPSAADRLARGYPEGRLGRSLASTADMIRASRGPRIVAIDHDGYDTHVDQGDGRAGVLTHRLDRLARGLTAFWTDVEALGPARAPVTVVAVSEFGRTIDENGSGGTEHGRGGVALALGDRVVGGVHGDLPALDRDEVWPVTVDVRRVLADAASSHGYRPWRGGIFPGLALPKRSLGLLLSP